MRAATIAAALALAAGAQANYFPYPHPAVDINSQVNSQAVNSGVTQSAGGDKAYGGANIGNNANFAATGGNAIEGENVNVNDRKLLGVPAPKPNVDYKPYVDYKPDVDYNSQINSQAVNSGVTQSAGGDKAVWGSNIGNNVNKAFTGGNYLAAANVNKNARRSLLNWYPEGPNVDFNSQINSQAANTGVTQSAGGDKAVGGANIGKNENVAVTGGNDLQASNFNFNGRHLLTGYPAYYPVSVASQAQQTNAQQQQTGNEQYGSVNTGGFNVAPTWNQANSGGNGQEASNSGFTGAYGRHLLGAYYPATAESQAQQTNGQQQLTGNQQYGSKNTGSFNVAPTWNQANSGGNGQSAENKDVTAAGFPWGGK